jgi:hypothetical protein
MNSAPNVVPIFAVPFGVVTLADAQTLNTEVRPLLAARATAEWRDPADRGGSFSFRSRDDLHGWPEKPIKQLLDSMLRGVAAVAGSINELSAEQFQGLQMQSRAWFTIIGYNGCVAPTSYPNTAWAALYCVAAPPSASARFDSGALRLLESRGGTSFQDASHGGIRIPYRPGHYLWRPVPGEMAVFPASIAHEIALVRAAGSLVVVTARVRFVGSGASWMPPW